MTVPEAPAPLDPAAPDGAPPFKQDKKPHSTKRQLIEWGLILGGALLVAVIVQMFFLKVFWIPTESMDPTLKVGDRVAVNKLAFRSDTPNRGDIIVFERPAGTSGPKDLIKRVIGLPGETVEGRNGQIFINEQPLDEPYLTEEAKSSTIVTFQPVTVPAGHFWMMGDNRPRSADSRVFGPIEEDSIIGRAFVRIWPPTKLGLL